MKTNMKYSKQHKRNLRKSFKMGWDIAQASLELYNKNSILALSGSYFDYDNQENVWRNHFGFKAKLGFWLAEP